MDIYKDTGLVGEVVNEWAGHSGSRHNRAVESALPERAYFPSGEKARERMAARCPSSRRSSLWPITSHKRIELSPPGLWPYQSSSLPPPPESIRRPSPRMATAHSH